MARSRFSKAERDPDSQNAYKRFAGVKGKRKKRVAAIHIEAFGFWKVRPRYRRAE